MAQLVVCNRVIQQPRRHPHNSQHFTVTARALGVGTGGSHSHAPGLASGPDLVDRPKISGLICSMTEATTQDAVNSGCQSNTRGRAGPRGRVRTMTNTCRCPPCCDANICAPSSHSFDVGTAASYVM